MKWLCNLVFLLNFTVQKRLWKNCDWNQYPENWSSSYCWCNDQWLWWSESEVWIWSWSCLFPWLRLGWRTYKINRKKYLGATNPFYATCKFWIRMVEKTTCYVYLYRLEISMPLQGTESLHDKSFKNHKNTS